MARQDQVGSYVFNIHEFAELLRKYNVPWEEVAPYIMESQKTSHNSRFTKADVVAALDGMLDAFLRVHGCRERVDCAKYPEYERGLSIIASIREAHTA